MNRNKLIWTIITILILVVGGAFNGWLWFSLRAQTIEELEKETGKKKIALAKLKGPVNNELPKRDGLPTIKKNLKQFKIELEKLIKRVPNLDRTEYDKFADELDELRKRSGVFVWSAKWVKAKKVRPSRGLTAKTWPDNTMHKVQYDLDITGSFFQLLRFVRMLEMEQRFVNVSNFTISPGESSTDSAFLERKMSLELYSFTYRQTDKALEIERQREPKRKTTEIPE